MKQLSLRTFSTQTQQDAAIRLILARSTFRASALNRVHEMYQRVYGDLAQIVKEDGWPRFDLVETLEGPSWTGYSQTHGQGNYEVSDLHLTFTLTFHNVACTMVRQVQYHYVLRVVRATSLFAAEATQLEVLDVIERLDPIRRPTRTVTQQPIHA